MIPFDEQVVECEIEVDTFDREIEGFKEQEDGDYEQEEIQNPEEDSYHHEYYEEEEEEEVVEEEIVDPNSVFLFDEDTSQIHEINDPSVPHGHHQHHHPSYQYLQEENPTTSTSSDNQPGPSPSSASSSSAPPQVPPPGPPSGQKPTQFQAHQRGLIRYHQMPRNPQNPATATYFIRKGGTGERGRIEGPSEYSSPLHFQTQYSIEPLARSGKRVIKRTHAMMSVEEMETMMEDAQVMKRIQTEIAALKKTNEEMKKAYETTHRRCETMNMVWMEAKQKQRNALQEKRELTRALTQARTTHSQLVKQLNQSGPQYQFH